MSRPPNPRSLKDVSHLFLSSAVPTAPPARPRAEAIVFIVAAGRSAGRARLAAGAAAAFARQGTRVSVCELASNLPNVGYYFGLEPVDYLAPALNRSALVSGVWNGSIRFGASLDRRSLARFEGGPLPGEGAHILVAACTACSGAASALALAGAIGAFAAGVETVHPAPDAIVVAEGDDGGAEAGALVRELRARWPEAFLALLARRPETRAEEADERFEAPPDFGAAASRRSPPTDPLFNELASVFLQRFGSRRRHDERRSTHS